MKVLLSLSAGFVLAVLSANGVNPAAAAPEEATAFQHDSLHSGTAHFERGLSFPLRRKWVRDLGDDVSYPLIAKHTVFVTVRNKPNGTLLYALNIRNGQTIWQQPIKGSHHWANATYARDRVFVLNADGLLRSFAADSGAPGWTYQLPVSGPVSGAPVAYGGKVYVAAGGAFALVAASGQLLWGHPGNDGTADGGPASPVIGCGLDFYANGAAYGRGGKLEWQWNNDQRTAVCFGGLVLRGGDVMSTNGDNLYQLPGTPTCPVFWTVGNWEISLTFTSALEASDDRTAETAWRFAGDGRLSGAPLLIDNSVVIGSSRGNLFVVDAATGQSQWRDKVGAPFLPTGEEGRYGPGELSRPWTGFAAAEETLIVPASHLLIAYVSKHRHAQ